MNELLDKLILRIIFSLFIIVLLAAYRFIHTFFYPSTRGDVLKKFYPSQNTAYSLQFFSRIIGVGIIFSSLFFHLNDGLGFAMLGFAIQTILAFILYLLSIYILESITLYNFEFDDDVSMGVGFRDEIYTTIVKKIQVETELQENKDDIIDGFSLSDTRTESIACEFINKIKEKMADDIFEEYKNTDLDRSKFNLFFEGGIIKFFPKYK